VSALCRVLSADGTPATIKVLLLAMSMFAVLPSLICPHLLIQLVILEQLIEPLEHRIGLLCHFRHARKDIFWLIAVHEHAASLLR
jgi:hypothetical protein